jgi:hypothetical protein
MQNYIHGEVVSPTGKFEALQTADGHAMLFAISTSGVLNVTEESSGTSRTGWTETDLSTKFIEDHLHDATVRTFDVGQSAVDGTIGMAVAVTSGTSDQLFLCLNNSNVDTSWTANPTWVAYPFDAHNQSQATLSIVGILFAELIDNQQYLIVDIDRSSESAIKDIVRYYIDPTKSSGSYWIRNDVPVDIESGDYQSCVGKTADAYVEGVYTMGTAGTSSQLVYVPIINAYGDGPPMPTRLRLPGGIIGTAMATARNDSQDSPLHGTTDLYVVGGSSLYIITATAQDRDESTAKLVLTNNIFSGTSKLAAMMHEGVTTLWGRNANNEVYYMSCEAHLVSDPGSWSRAIPILSNIEQMSAFVNRTDGGRTIFATGGGRFQRITQATQTTSKLWSSQDIVLAAKQLTQSSTSFKSYTTSIRLVNKAKNIPATNVPVFISAASRTPGKFRSNGCSRPRAYYLCSLHVTSTSP